MPQSLHVLSAHIIFSNHQEEHHKTESFKEELLRILKKYQVPYDERYLWD